MNDREWGQLVAALRELGDGDECIDIATTLMTQVTGADVPRLTELLNDRSDLARAAAAWRLSDLGVIRALPDLLRAYADRREEYDRWYGGLWEALTALVLANATDAEPMLEQLSTNVDDEVREAALRLTDSIQTWRDA